MRKKLVLAVPAAVFVVIAVLFALQPGRESRTTAQFEADRAVLEEMAKQVLVQGTARDMEVPAPWLGVELYANGIHTVEFAMGGSGLGSETTYWGVNYVPSDSMVGFQGIRWDYWKQDGDGRMYYEPEGDNTCYVKKLDECWYYYEMNF